VPSAWKFRQEFQSRLGIVFDHLANIYHSFPGRITAETFKKQITSIIDIWEDWIVFPPDFTSELRMRLEGTTMEAEPTSEHVAGDIQQNADAHRSRFKATSFQLATYPVEGDTEISEDGEPMEVGSDIGQFVTMDEAPAEDDLDGEPLKDDVDGEPLNDDVDGVPMNDDADDADDVYCDGTSIDGQAMDEDSL
jgi:U2-associated protein SR140